MIRIKLIFDDNILIAEEYRKIWLLIPDTVHYVSDLVYLIKTKFSLKNASSKGLYLILDEFTLPLTQNIQLIRENDVIIVKNKQHTSALVETSSSSSKSDSSEESVQQHDTTRDEHNGRTNTIAPHAHKSESVAEDSSDSEQSDQQARVPHNMVPSPPVTARAKTQGPSPVCASHVPQRRGESLGRGYRAPQWPWLPFTVASHTDTTPATDSSVSLSALQYEDVIAFRTMELEGWQPVLSPVKRATVRAVTPHSLTVHLLTGVTEESEEVTFAAEDLIDLTVVNKHS